MHHIESNIVISPFIPRSFKIKSHQRLGILTFFQNINAIFEIKITSTLIFKVVSPLLTLYLCFLDQNSPEKYIVNVLLLIVQGVTRSPTLRMLMFNSHDKL